jgi:hypothetical protein
MSTLSQISIACQDCSDSLVPLDPNELGDGVIFRFLQRHARHTVLACCVLRDARGNHYTVEGVILRNSLSPAG